jgi:D-alanyl-D-alanine dipeptidase
MSALLEARIAMTRALPHLLDAMFARGHAASMEWCKRCIDCPVGKKRSKHKDGTAVDINLYRRGASGAWVLCADTKDHAQFGSLWESMGGIWGGRWQDGNHYEWPET